MISRSHRATHCIARRHSVVGDVAVLVVALLLTATSVFGQRPGGGPPPPAPVRGGRVMLEPAHARGVSFVGTIQPLKTSVVGSLVEGQVEAYRVNEGDYVVAGAVLAKLRTVDLEIDKKRAEAELKLLESTLAELELSMPIEIEQARAAKGGAEALLKFADDRLARTRKLLETSPEVVTQEELEESISTQTAAKEDYNAKAAAYELAAGGLWARRIEQAETRVEAQRQAVGLIDDEFEQHTIKAPFDGYVTKEFTEIGQWVAKGGDVAEMIQIDQVDLVVPVLETYAPLLRVGLVGTVEVETYPDWIFEGTVALIVPAADPQSRSFPVKVRIDNQRQAGQSEEDAVSLRDPPSPIAAGDASDIGSQPQMQLKPGMFARVNLPVGNPQQLTLVHKDALVLERTQKSVFVVDLDTKLEMPGVGEVRQVPVRLGVFYDTFVEVYGELQPGQVVVTEGNERLNEGRTVRIVNFSELSQPDSADPAAGPGRAR